MTVLRDIENNVLGTKDGAVKVEIHVEDEVTKYGILHWKCQGLY